MKLLKNPLSFSIIEKDLELAKNLKEKYKYHKNIKVFNDDILKFDLEKIVKKKINYIWQSSLQHFFTDFR